MNGIVLHGTPGNGKTVAVDASIYAAKAIDGKSDLTVLSCSAGQVRSCYIGDGEKVVERMFEAAKAQAPCILFFDETNGII